MTPTRWFLSGLTLLLGALLVVQMGLFSTPSLPQPTLEGIAGLGNGPTVSASLDTVVELISPKKASLSATRLTSVVIEPARESRVAAATSGRVLAVLKREDTAVAANEAVVQLDAGTLQLRKQNLQLRINSAQVSLQRATQANQEEGTQASTRFLTAETTLRLAEQQYKEGLELNQIGAMAPAELALLETQLSQARSDYTLAQNDVARSSRATGESLEILRLQRDQASTELALLEREISEAVVKAPYAGEITELLVDEGEYVEEGTPVFELATLDEQVARFSVPPEVATRYLEEGTMWIRYSGSDYAARVISQSRVDPETQLVEVTAELYASQVRMPNGVVVQLPYKYELAQGIILPSEAVNREDVQASVYVVQDDKVARQPVRVIAEVDGQVAVEGITEALQVIYPIPKNLRVGSTVVVASATPSE